MSESTEPTNRSQPTEQTSAAAAAAGFLHRVCTQCNNMFRVPTDKFDAKQCPNCHKG